MAGKISSFVSSGMLVIRINKVQFAYCQSLAFSQNVNITPVGGIGSFSYGALEPTAFAANGSIRILRWDARLWNSIKDASPTDIEKNNFFPDNIKADAPSTLAKHQGNSLLDTVAFNPVSLLVSATFDIDVYERNAAALGIDATSGIVTPNLSLATSDLFVTLKDCRLTDYSYDFAPGQLLIENVNYVCAQVIENFS